MSLLGVNKRYLCTFEQRRNLVVLSDVLSDVSILIIINTHPLTPLGSFRFLSFHALWCLVSTLVQMLKQNVANVRTSVSRIIEIRRGNCLRLMGNK